MIQRVVIDVDADEGDARLQMPPDPHRSTVCDHIVCGGDLGRRAVEPRRHAARVRLELARSQAANAPRRRRGDRRVRDVLEETVATFFESATAASTGAYLPASNELIWFSRARQLGPLYLYDLTTGTAEEPDHDRRGQRHPDAARRREGAHDLLPRRRQGEGPRPVLPSPLPRRLRRQEPDAADARGRRPHVALSPTGKYFVDTYSKPDVAAGRGAARQRPGKLVVALEKADISRLVATGWKPPMPITVKARDGKTDLYGLMFTPTNFDPTKKYPIINHIYPGPQSGSVGSRSFSAARGDTRRSPSSASSSSRSTAWARRGARRRSTTRTTANMGDNTLPDQVAGMKRARRSATRGSTSIASGIWGHSGGGFATADAMFRYPGLLQGRHLGVGQPRQPQLRGRLGREVAGAAREEPRRHDQLRRPGEPDCTRRT